MTLSRPELASELDETTASQFEGEIREFVRRDVAPVRRVGSDVSPEAAVSNINSLVQRVAGASLQEIEMLIAELQNLRLHLEREGERVERELAGYAHLNQTTMRSTKIIAENMAQWKSALDARAE